jgi:hypothetical protein
MGYGQRRLLTTLVLREAHGRPAVKCWELQEVRKIQGDRILIPSIDVEGRLEGDLSTGPWLVDACSTLLLLWAI